MGLRFLAESGALKLFPELMALQGCPQEPEWHPEGDVVSHTLPVLDEAARVCELEGVFGAERMVILLAALCHDFPGQPAHLQLDDGRIGLEATKVAVRHPREVFWRGWASRKQPSKRWSLWSKNT